MTDTQTLKENRRAVTTDYDAPAMWRVVFHNDDVTPAGFVAAILQKVYDYDVERAIAAVTRIGVEGQGVVGVYLKAVAVLKKRITDGASRTAGYPLKVTIEREENQ